MMKSRTINIPIACDPVRAYALNTPITMTDTAAVPGRRFGLLLWVAGMLGVVVVTATVLPQLSGQVTLPAPLWVISLASLAQSALLLALAVWAGVALAPAVGLRAPAFEAAVTGRPVGPAGTCKRANEPSEVRCDQSPVGPTRSLAPRCS